MSTDLEQLLTNTKKELRQSPTVQPETKYNCYQIVIAVLLKINSGIHETPRFLSLSDLTLSVSVDLLHAAAMVSNNLESIHWVESTWSILNPTGFFSKVQYSRVCNVWIQVKFHIFQYWFLFFVQVSYVQMFRHLLITAKSVPVGTKTPARKAFWLKVMGSKEEWSETRVGYLGYLPISHHPPTLSYCGAKMEV